MIELFYEKAHQFLREVFSRCDQLEISIPEHWDVDHLCYRVEDQQSYQQYQQFLLSIGKLLVESPVSGRMISTFQLHQPIEFRDWRIDLIELPAPKMGKVVKEGFEHLEIVCDCPLEGLASLYPQAHFDSKGLGKEFNAEYEMNLGEMNIKFHHLSLDSVIRLETHPDIWRSLNDLKILENYKDFHALVAGTYPLGIATTQSDIDIILSFALPEELEKLEARIIADFSQMKDFKLKKELIKDQFTLVSSFYHQDHKFELFAQNRSSVQQDAYQHYLCEEKILKYAPTQFRNQVIALKQEGLKTEPAFAKLLNLTHDPYEAMLELQKISIKKLRQML